MSKRVPAGIRLCLGALAMLGLMAGAHAVPDTAGRVIEVQSDELAPGLTEDEFDERQAALLDDLFLRLRSAEDERSAQLIEQAVWQLWLRSGSDTVDLLLQQAIQALNADDNDSALKILDAIVVLAPQFPEGWNKRATVYYLMDRYDEAMRDIARVLELEPRHFGAISGIALIRRELGDTEQALAAFQRALEIHPYLPGAQQAIDELSEEVEGQGI